MKTVQWWLKLCSVWSISLQNELIQHPAHLYFLDMFFFTSDKLMLPETPSRRVPNRFIIAHSRNPTLTHKPTICQ